MAMNQVGRHAAVERVQHCLRSAHHLLLLSTQEKKGSCLNWTSLALPQLSSAGPVPGGQCSDLLKCCPRSLLEVCVLSSEVGALGWEGIH